MSDATRPPSRRLAYLDWLRFLVVLSLTPFHAAISFTGMGVVYVYDAPVRDAILAGTNRGLLGPEAMRIFTVFMDNWFMHLLFFVSGIGAAIALKKRSPGSFLGERAQRLLLPLFLGCILVIPIQSWFRAYSFGRFEGGLLAFPLYILHYAPLCGATYILLGSGLFIWLRWSLAVAASWATVAAFTALARYIPSLRSFFGIRRPVPR